MFDLLLESSQRDFFNKWSNMCEEIGIIEIEIRSFSVALDSSYWTHVLKLGDLEDIFVYYHITSIAQWYRRPTLDLGVVNSSLSIGTHIPVLCNTWVNKGCMSDFFFF